MNFRNRFFAGFFGVLLCTAPVLGTSFGYKGLIAGWAIGSLQGALDPQLGLRYIPEFTLQEDLSTTVFLDAEFSLNAFGTARFVSGEDAYTDGEVDPYRMWMRFSTAKFEARVGLQKINFGSASMLRPLMWFDSLDPRDPLQLTDGVYALLLRYFFVNNANVWVWGLYGNEKTKGWEQLPTVKDTVEYGGRIQLPVFTGELALTYHHRRADLSDYPVPAPLQPGYDLVAPEDRLGLDGKWDVGIGLWVEASLVHQDNDIVPWPWQRALNIGADYTFGLGNGLNVMAEHFRLERSEKAFAAGNRVDFTAVFLRYPVGILDDATAILYYDWDKKDFYRLLNWQRTYDRWRFNVIAFWNPDEFLIYPSQPGNNPFAGRGFQLMVAFNH
jgi:hypothetical protein